MTEYLCRLQLHLAGNTHVCSGFKFGCTRGDAQVAVGGKCQALFFSLVFDWCKTVRLSLFFRKREVSSETERWGGGGGVACERRFRLNRGRRAVALSWVYAAAEGVDRRGSPWDKTPPEGFGRRPSCTPTRDGQGYVLVVVRYEYVRSRIAAA